MTSTSDRADMIDLHTLAPVDAINGARIAKLTGETRFSNAGPIILRAFKAVVGEKCFPVGFCVGDGEAFSAIGLAVIERVAMEASGDKLYVVPIVHEDIAWDLVLRHLRTFSGPALLFAFRDSDVYDAGTAEIGYSNQIRQFDHHGVPIRRLTTVERQQIREQKAAILNRPPPPKFYPAAAGAHEDSPWIFRFCTPSGKMIRVAAWDGRRNYAHEMPADITTWVGGDKIAIVQVDKPVGVSGRSSPRLTHLLAKDFDGIIHWARDSDTFQSILRSFIRLDYESISAPVLPEGWKPEVIFIAANAEASVAD